MRKKVISLFVMVLLIASMGQISLAQTQNSTSPNKFSGEEYFEGLMFGQGEVGKIIASQISDDELTKQAKSSEGKKAIAAITDFIEKEDPTYFNELKSSIEKKDPSSLVETLATGEELIVSFAETSENGTELITGENAVTPEACGPTVCVLVVVAGVYLYVGGVQGVVLQTGAAVTTGIWKYVAYTSSTKQQSYAIEQASVETLDLLTE